MTDPSPPPGWYADPSDDSARRWWDGTTWTGYVEGAYELVAAPDPNEGLVWLLPVGRSGWAIASGYLGLLSVLCVFAPFALITGLFALRALKRDPALLGQGRAWFGVVMGVVFTIVLGVAVIGSLAR